MIVEFGCLNKYIIYYIFVVMKLLSILLFLAIFSELSYGKGFISSDSTVTTEYHILKSGEFQRRKFNASAYKLGILELGSGMVGLYYERELGKIISFQPGAGLTTRNWVYNALMEGKEADQSSPNFIKNDDFLDEDYTFKDRKAKPGYFLSFTCKAYLFDEDGMEGQYIALNVQYRKYRFLAYGDVSGVDQLQSGQSDKHEEENHLLTGVYYGGQLLKSISCIDWSFGAGLRRVDGSRRDLGYEISGSGNRKLVVGEKFRTIDKNLLFIEFTLRLGIWKARVKK